MEDVARQHQYPVAAARLRDNAGGEVLETFECLAIQSALSQDVLVWTPGPAKNPGKRMRPSRFRGAVFGMYAECNEFRVFFGFLACKFRDSPCTM